MLQNCHHRRMLAFALCGNRIKALENVIDFPDYLGTVMPAKLGLGGGRRHKQADAGDRESLKQGAVLDFGLPEGVHSFLLMDGNPLTSEQCLRLTLARAIAGRPRLLLLDGVLHRIDHRFLPALLDMLLAADAPWTLIMTSQHPEIISRFKRHAVIREGLLRETASENPGDL